MRLGKVSRIFLTPMKLIFDKIYIHINPLMPHTLTYKFMYLSVVLLLDCCLGLRYVFRGTF